MQQNLVSENEFWFQSCIHSCIYSPYADTNLTIREPTCRSVMCKYHISPVNWHNRLRITVGMTTGVGMKWVVTWCIEGWADKAGEHECVFHGERQASTHQNRFPITTCSLREEVRVPAKVGGWSGPAHVGRWGGLETWRWMTGPWSDLAGPPRANPLIECSCWGSALGRGTRPPTRRAASRPLAERHPDSQSISAATLPEEQLSFSHLLLNASQNKLLC